jgi:hypothetical protein
VKKYTVLIADSAVSDIDDIVNWFLSVNNKYAKKLYYNLNIFKEKNSFTSGISRQRKNCPGT